MFSRCSTPCGRKTLLTVSTYYLSIRKPKRLQSKYSVNFVRMLVSEFFFIFFFFYKLLGNSRNDLSKVQSCVRSIISNPRKNDTWNFRNDFTASISVFRGEIDGTNKSIKIRTKSIRKFKCCTLFFDKIIQNKMFASACVCIL